MAEQQAAPAAPEAPQKKKLPIKAAIILVLVLVVEAAIISSVFIFTGGPNEIQGSTQTERDQMEALEKPVEILVVSDKFQNNVSGLSYMYEMDIFVVVRRKYEEEIELQIQFKNAQIASDIRTIISQAEPTHLHEPTLATLTRQIRKKLDERFAIETEDGSPVVEDVAIPKFSQYRSDG